MQINLKQGDCLELMKEIPDGSIDMILFIGYELEQKYFDIAKERIEKELKEN